MVGYHHGKEFTYFTGEYCHEKDFDAKHCRFRRSYFGWQVANDMLEELQSKLTNALRRAKADGVSLSNQQMRAVLEPENSKSDQKHILADEMSAYVAYLKRSGLKDSSLKWHVIIERHAREYQAKRSECLQANKFTREVAHKLMDYILSVKDYHPNSLGAIHKTLNSFFHYYTDELQQKLHPAHYWLKKLYIMPARIFLTLDEVKSMQKVDEATYEEYKLQHPDAKLATWTTVEKIRDRFLFACVTGFRFGDQDRLTQQHMYEFEGQTMIQLILEKSASAKARKERSQTCVLIPEAKQIVEKYQGMYGDKLLPPMSMQQFNKHIKIVAKLAGITQAIETTKYVNRKPQTVQVPKYELISSHSARHTCATLSRLFGASLHDIQAMLGHADIRTTEIYEHLAAEHKANFVANAWRGKI